MTEKPTIIGLCTANRCRSQMFDSLLTMLGGDRFNVVSAGTKATFVHPLTQVVLSEINAPTDHLRSKQINSIDTQNNQLVLEDNEGNTVTTPLSQIHTLITLCGGAAENCPIIPGVQRKLHWPIDDPDQYEGTDEEVLPYFRQSRDDIQNRIIQFLEETQ